MALEIQRSAPLSTEIRGSKSHALVLLSGELDVSTAGGLYEELAGLEFRPFTEIPLDEWHRVIDVDLWGVIHGVRTFVPLILASGEEGHVVNVASMAAVLTIPRLAPYTVANHGVLGLTDVLRAELEGLGAPVGASVVMPGMVKTAMNPIGTVPAATVAANVLDAIQNDRAYVFTDDHSTEDVERRLRDVLAARADVIT